MIKYIALFVGFLSVALTYYPALADKIGLMESTLQNTAPVFAVVSLAYLCLIVPFQKHEKVTEDLEKLRGELIPKFSIEPAKPNKYFSNANQNACRLKLCNNSSRSIDEIKLEILQINSGHLHEIECLSLVVKFPEDVLDSDALYSLNPGRTLEFDLLEGLRNTHASHVSVSTIRHGFSGHFELNKNYPVQIRITGRDMISTVLSINIKCVALGSDGFNFVTEAVGSKAGSFRSNMPCFP